MNCPDAIIPGNVLSDPACALQAIFKLVSFGLSWGIAGAAAFAILFIVLGGFKWIQAGNDPKAMQSAQQTIFWAVVGLIIIASAYGFMRIISSAIPGGLPGFSPSQPTPTSAPSCGQTGDPCSAGNPCCAGLNCISHFCQ